MDIRLNKLRSEGQGSLECYGAKKWVFETEDKKTDSQDQERLVVPRGGGDGKMGSLGLADANYESPFNNRRTNHKMGKKWRKKIHIDWRSCA